MLMKRDRIRSDLMKICTRNPSYLVRIYIDKVPEERDEGESVE